ncbi:MAG: Crp/Fnr family transcriptional regulator, partial [Bacteroidota bacterium]
MIGDINNILDFLIEEAKKHPPTTLEKDEWLCKEGDLCEGIFLITKGSVVVNKQGHWIRFLVAGDIAGVTAINDGFANVNIKALEPTTIICFKKDFLHEKMRENHLLRFSLIQLMCQELEIIDKQLQLVTFKDAYKKVALMLLALEEVFDTQAQVENAIDFDYKKMAQWNSISIRLFKQT